MATDILDTSQAGPTAIRGAALRVGGYVASSALSVVSAAVMLRYLGVAEYGRYTTIFSLMTIVLGVSEAGTTQIGVREYAAGKEVDRRAVLANLQGLRLVLTFVGSLLAIGFAVVAGYTDEMVLGTALYGVGLLLTAAALTLIIPLQAELRLGAVTAIELVRQVGLVVVLVGLVAAGAGLVAFLASPIPVGLLLLVVTVAVVRRSVPIGVSFHPDRWRALLADTLPYAAAVAMGVLYSYVTIVLMSLVATEIETGLFGAAHRIFYVLTAIPALLVGAAFPIMARAARDDHDRLRYAVQRLFEALLLCGAGLGLLTVVGAPVAIDVVAGPDYAEAVPVLRILGGALAATSLIALGSFGLLSLRRHTALLVGNVLGLLVTAVLTLVLGERHGAQGAAVALLAGEIMLGVSLFTTMARSAGVRPGLGILPRMAACVALALVPGLLLGLPALVATVLAALVFTAAAFLLRVVPEEILEAFSAVRPGRRARAGADSPPPPDPS